MEHQAYWQNLMQGAIEQPERSIRIGGTHWWKYLESTDGKAFLPYNGRKFNIRYIENEQTETVMMWYNARIPAEIQWLLPDNAEWAK